MYNTVKLKRGITMSKHKYLAKKILSLDNYDVDYKPAPLKLKDSIKVSDLFYEYFFKDYDIYNINDKLYFDKDDELIDYDGACKSKGYISGNISSIMILTPTLESTKNIVTITHEKAHAYNFFNKRRVSEVVPSFMDIMQSIYLDKVAPGIKKDNINYKINQAKIAAKIYLKKSRLFYSDKMLENQINYMNDFLKTFLLLREYQESSDNVKDILYNNLFTNNKDIFDKNNYIDDNNIIEKIEFIKKI